MIIRWQTPFQSFSLCISLCIGFPLFATLAIAQTQDAAVEKESVSPADMEIKSQVQKAIFEGINSYRKDSELPSLTHDSELERAAIDFARFMARTDKYGHHADGSTPAKRAKAAGYRYCVIRENIAYRTNTGTVTPESLTDVFVQGWIDSPPHRENILADYVVETGVGVATDDGVTFYAVQLFGRPKSSAFTIEVTNRSDEEETLAIESNGNRDEVDLAPNMRIRLTRCLPTELMLEDADSPVSISEATAWVIGDNGLQRADETEPARR